MTKCYIEGVLLNSLKQISDPRGDILHMMRVDSSGFKGFGEVYFSEVIPGAIKAWKLHERQTQNFAVPVGRILLTIFDDRQGSPSCGMVQELELGRPDAYFRVTIEPGLWYGLSCIGDGPALLTNCADLPHDPSESRARELTYPGMPLLRK